MPLDDTTKHYEQALAPQADPFTLPALIAWLRTKPARKTYVYECNGGCLVAMYLIAHNLAKKPSVIPAGWSDGLKYHSMPAGWNDIAVGRVPEKSGLPESRTFGAALARAEALAKSEAGGTP